ncbi:antitoxin of toxin-antitoxin stability system [Stutzerimonas nitrititolerans]|uniref:antitoxin of toxin-antitoxin stability system n=1 Tax=Stutzerimonas nitrititolerans TaxID=2482751 RepID=UPI0028AB0B59|nr:antitoxin of toxin-antitoxin stability system [Stutzerimonas nitrititolerans]
MAKENVFQLQLEPARLEEFTAAAKAVHRPASQVMRDLMCDFIRQQQTRKHDEFVQLKIAVARASLEAGRGRSNDNVEAEFAAHRVKGQGPE